MAHIDVLTKDDGFPSDFTHKRVSDAKDRKDEVLAYKHLLLGWMGPKSAFMLKLVAENAKDIIKMGYQVNFKIMDMMLPSGGILVGAITGIADIVIWKYFQDYAGEQARKNKTTKGMEMAKLLVIMAMPFGMVYLLGVVGFQISKEDWGSLWERTATVGMQSWFLPVGIIGKLFGEPVEEWFKVKP